ncbi:MAG: hypothetical protein JWM28_3618 [Chitinophagaceae bacterium]|nr:hypothetical protein [Chitinophagaceae bacterium]
MQKSIPILFFVLMVGSICWCIYRDTQIEKGYTGDLRNRIVGARLQNAGRPPYFYKWENGQSLRYYDPQNFDTLKVSNITATPFFHQLLYPLADLQQRTISKIWLVIEYLMLLVMTAIAFSFAKNRNQKMAVIITTAIFLYTNAWTGHIAAGQLYLFIPFLAMLFYYFSKRGDQLLYVFLSGSCAAALILIRPNTIIFFLPFLFIMNRCSLKYKTTFFISLALIFFFAFNSNQKILYWKDYRAALSEQLKSHQQLHPAVQQNDPGPVFVNWEGWDMKQVAKDAAQFPYSYNAEHGNVFVLANHAFNIQTPVWLLVASLLLFMMILLFLFYKKYKHTSSFDFYYIAILAFCLYMGSDILSPIHRFQYNATQWLFPLLLTASDYRPKYKWIYGGIVAGLALNSLNTSFLVMEQTVGEYIVFLSLLILLLSHKPEAST